ncbi:zinc-dependent peptidase [Lutimaribacter sp. EGI FJ00015]|uniref:Zinc-dependent peptidase n=1 Tax=Lutimaribacter degradans TaxID=2945989 RepID=A0ACC5ZR68_9RHOB|nr:M90 family metallopeptidase [Lutimaribacter sp. EGI FJ00013]MCM2560668.1 zinc-dependent peptidase [Lutimaribacter sp. EGI FJ00013]MCO0612388.1 zinc-dependent peptidase [Lutimaribacter sp. EGI FJ00015]MCO0634492.1 zinc-dependent peptidase [Lutimaribacter sp. EGI FJ00014]
MLYLALFLGPAAVAGLLLWRRRARARAIAGLLSTPLTPAQRALVEKEVPLTRRLPADLRTALEGRINRFLDQVDFHGCNGLDVTQEMKLSIAAQASLLLVNSDQWYDGLTTILVYPNAFKSVQRHHSGYVVTEKEIVRSGESWLHGPVILSWAHSRQGALNDRDGQNVVFHEFAHQIDALTGATNGVPVLGPGQSFAEWEKAFLTAYKDHTHQVSRGRKTAIDAYGAENHEEFFAVAVEMFFEKPQALKRDAPEIYAQMGKLFRLDPADWPDPAN